MKKLNGVLEVTNFLKAVDNHIKEYNKMILIGKEAEAENVKELLNEVLGFEYKNFLTAKYDEFKAEFYHEESKTNESLMKEEYEFALENVMYLNNIIESEGLNVKLTIEEEESPLTAEATAEEAEEVAVENKIEKTEEKTMEAKAVVTEEVKVVVTETTATEIKKEGVEKNMKQKFNNFIYNNVDNSKDQSAIILKKEEISEMKKEILEKINDVKDVRLFTNFHVGEVEKFNEIFNKVLFLASNSFEVRYTSAQEMSLRADMNTGFTAYSKFKAATENALFQQGAKNAAQESKKQELLSMTKKEAKGNKEVIVTEKTSMETLEAIELASQHLVQTVESTYNLAKNEGDNDFVKLLKGLTIKYGVTLPSMGTVIKKENSIVKKVTIKGTENWNDLIVPILRPIQIGNIVMLTDGQSVFSGSVQYTDSENKNIYLNTMQTYIKFIEQYIKNMKNELKQDASMLLYDSKDEDEEKASIFVRVGSLNDLFAITSKEGKVERIGFKALSDFINLNRGEKDFTTALNELIFNGKVEIVTAKKTLTLMGNHHEVNELIFAKMVFDGIEIDNNKDQLILEAKNHTIAAGAGNNVAYRICNLLGKYLISDEDKYMSNLFAGIGGMTKASRFNNPDSNYINKKYSTILRNWRGDAIPSNYKSAALVMINTTDISQNGVPFYKALKGFSYNNSLDCYAAGEDMKDNFRTISDVDSEYQYVVGDISEDFKEDAYHYYKTGEIVGNLISTTNEEKMRILGKLRKLPEFSVTKMSFCHLKGSFVYLKDNFSFEAIEGNGVTEKELEFIKKSYAISNNILHKQEFANNHVISEQLKRQINEGKEMFDVSLPSLITEPSVKDIKEIYLIVNGEKFKVKFVYTVANVHDLKNNLVSQGDNTLKEMYSNIQDFNSTRWLSKNALGVVYGNEFLRAYYSANREIKKCSLKEVKEVEGLKVYVNTKINGYNEIKEKIQERGMSVETNIQESDVIFNGKLFEENKVFMMDKFFNIQKIVISDSENGEVKEGEFLINSKRTRKYYTKKEVFNILQESEVLSYEELNRVISLPGRNKITFLDLLGKMASKNLTRISEACKFLKGYNIGGKRVTGILEILSNVRGLEILPGKYMIFLPSMKKISVYFPKELTVAIKVAQDALKLSSHEGIVNSILNGEVKDLKSYYEFLKSNFEQYCPMFDLIKAENLKTIFDINNHIPAEKGMVYVLKNENKIGIYDMLESLNALVRFHEEKLFTKNAKYLLSDSRTSFYGTALTMHCKQNEVRINPNSQGMKQYKEFAGKYILVGRFPTTGERGLGLKLILDENVPENCVLVHPAAGEQLMMDTDGDMMYCMFLSDSYCRKFTALEVNEEVYFNFYSHKPAFSKAYKKVMNIITGKEEKVFKEFDLTPSAVVRRNQEYREQAMFNPNFVGRITTACMKFANRVYEEFIENVDSSDKEALLKGKAVYEFYIRVVQKQLSQIPIAAKNTDTKALKDFQELWNSFSAGNLGIEEFSNFITVTGWDNLEGVTTGRLVTDIVDEVEIFVKDNFAEEKEAMKKALREARRLAREAEKKEVAKEEVKVSTENVEKIKNLLKF